MLVAETAPALAIVLVEEEAATLAFLSEVEPATGHALVHVEETGPVLDMVLAEEDAAALSIVHVSEAATVHNIAVRMLPLSPSQPLPRIIKFCTRHLAS